MRLHFQVYSRPEPQGSSRAFVIAGRARVTSANAKLKPFRSEVTRCAMAAIESEYGEQWGPKWEVMFKQHVPVKLTVVFTFRRPASLPKCRQHNTSRPDTDKLLRSIGDALTGSVWYDDSQVVEIVARKVYGPVEGADIIVEEAA